MTPRPADKNGKPDLRPLHWFYVIMSILIGSFCWSMGYVWGIDNRQVVSHAKTRYELSLERDNAELRETNQAYQRALRTALDDAKAITDRFSRTVFPVEDQSAVIAHQDRRIKQLEEDRAVEIEKRLIMARELNNLERGELIGGKIVILQEAEQVE